MCPNRPLSINGNNNPIRLQFEVKKIKFIAISIWTVALFPVFLANIYLNSDAFH